MDSESGVESTIWSHGKGLLVNSDESQKHGVSEILSPSLKSHFENPFEASATPERKDLTFVQDPVNRETPIGSVALFGVPIICLFIDGKERLCLAQISNTLLRDFSYNEIHNRRVALGITCMQCTPVQLEILRRTGAMPVSSRRCGLITKREAERLVRSFLEEVPPPKLPENFSFKVHHKCGWGCQGLFIPSRYNSSRAKCIKCLYCSSFFSPNKFIFHFHKAPSSSYRHPDAANFNSWRRHLFLSDPNPTESLTHTWEDVKAMFNGGCRKRMSITHSKPSVPKSVVPNFPSTVALPNSVVPPYPRVQGSSFYQGEIPDRTHPAFAMTQTRSNVGTYGEMLRSLSMNYSPWWKSLYFPRPQITSPANPYSHLPPHFTNLNYEAHIQRPSVENVYENKCFTQNERKAHQKKHHVEKYLNQCESETNQVVKEQGKVTLPKVSSTADAEMYTDFDDIIDIDTCDVVNIGDNNSMPINENFTEEDKDSDIHHISIVNSDQSKTCYSKDISNDTDDTGSGLEGEERQPEKTEIESKENIEDNRGEHLDLLENAELESLSIEQLRDLLIEARNMRMESEKKQKELKHVWEETLSKQKDAMQTETEDKTTDTI